MNKAKKVWQENKVLFVLAIIIAICLSVLILVSLKYFYGSSDTVYGSRLDVTKNVPLNEDALNNIKSSIKEDKTVDTVSVSKMGRIVYISIKFQDDTKMDDAKKVAEASLTSFKEEELNVYDLQYTITSTFTKEDNTNKSYTLMGARNSNGSGSIVWSNYNLEETEK